MTIMIIHPTLSNLRWSTPLVIDRLTGLRLVTFSNAADIYIFFLLFVFLSFRRPIILCPFSATYLKKTCRRGFRLLLFILVFIAASVEGWRWGWGWGCSFRLLNTVNCCFNHRSLIIGVRVMGGGGWLV